MAVCQNPACRQFLDDTFVFCPYCGQDTRSLDNRVFPAAHSHEYVQGGSYCWRCGLMDDVVAERGQAVRKGKTLVWWGTAVMVFAFLIALAGAALDNQAYNALIAERELLQKEGRLEAEGNKTFRASPVTAWAYPLGLVGAGLLIYGSFLWINNREGQWQVRV